MNFTLKTAIRCDLKQRMGRNRTGRESYNTSINSTLIDRLRRLAKNLGKRQNELVEEDIKYLLEKYERDDR